MTTTVLLAAALASCGKQEQAKVEKAASEVKKDAVADAKAAEAAAKEVEAREIAIDAYIYAYPLVTMELTRRVITNVEAPVGTKAPMGQFARAYVSARRRPLGDRAECRYALDPEMAGRVEGAVDSEHSGHAALLAEREAAIHSRRQLEATGGAGGFVDRRQRWARRTKLASVGPCAAPREGRMHRGRHCALRIALVFQLGENRWIGGAAGAPP